MITSGGNSTCQDADECSDPGTCPANSVCLNSEGSYDCECSDGYTRDDNGDCQECKCKKHEVCYEGKCKCKKAYKKNKEGHCVARIGKGLQGGSAQVSGYLRTFILGVLGRLALTA